MKLNKVRKVRYNLLFFGINLLATHETIANALTPYSPIAVHRFT